MKNFCVFSVPSQEAGNNVERAQQGITYSKGWTVYRAYRALHFVACFLYQEVSSD